MPAYRTRPSADLGNTGWVVPHRLGYHLVDRRPHAFALPAGVLTETNPTPPRGHRGEIWLWSRFAHTRTARSQYFAKCWTVYQQYDRAFGMFSRATD